MSASAPQSGPCASSVSKGLDRRLVAVMFTDMVGYTALMQIDERAAIDKRKRYAAALEANHDAGGGTIVQRLGDGSLSMFPNAIDAVRSAIGMQRELGAQDVPVRIGIHLGEVIVEPTGLVGDAVNIASRIESFAVPGSVMVSDSVHDLVQNRPDVTFTSLGRFRLKNVGRPFEIFAASADGIVVPDPRTLEGKGERFATLPGNVAGLDDAAARARRRPDGADRARVAAPCGHHHRAGGRREDERDDRARAAARTGVPGPCCVRPAGRGRHARWVRPRHR